MAESSANQSENNPTLAFAAMGVAVSLFAVMDTTGKWLLTKEGIPLFQVVFIRYFGHFLLGIALLMFQRGFGVLEGFRSNCIKVQILRALMLLLTTLMIFTALPHLSLNIVTAVMLSSPLMVTLLGAIFLKEQVGLRRFIATGLGFIGVLIIVQPTSQGFQLEIIYMLLAMCATSVYFVLTRVVAGRDTTLTGQVYISGIPSLILMPMAVSGWVWPSSASAAALLAFLGIVGALSHGLAAIAHRFSAASSLAPIIYTEVVSTTILSLWIFGYVPGWSTILGTAVIVGSGLYVWARERYRRISDTSLNPRFTLE